MRRIRTWLLVLLALLATPAAGAQGLQPELDTSSPRAAYQTFTSEIERIAAEFVVFRADPTNERQLEIFRALVRLGTRLFDLSDLPPATRVKHATTAVGYMADILVRLPRIPPEQIPGTPPTAAADLPATWTSPGTELRLRRLAEGSWAGSYVFTAETLERLPEFHAAIIGHPVLWSRHAGQANWHATQLNFVGPLMARLPVGALPWPLQTVLLGTLLWKAILSALVILLAAWLVVLYGRLSRRRAAGRPEWHRRLIWLGAAGVAALLTVLAELFIAWEINLVGVLFDITTVLAATALYAAAAWAAWVLIHLLVELIIVLPAIPDNSYDAHLLRLLARVGAVLAVLALVLHGASMIGVPALSLLAGVSVGGIALALAAQSTVENLFGGIAIFADRPFRVGDLIQGPSVNGTVERVGPRSSRIRAADGTLTTVPNSDLAKMHITNVTARNTFLFKHLVRLSGDTTRAQAEWLLEELRRRVAAEEAVRKAPGLPRVRLIGFGDASIDIEIFAQVPVETQAAFLEVQERLVLQVMKAVEAGGMRFTFATQPAAPEPATPVHPA